MKKHSRLLVLLLVFAMVFSMVACAGKPADSSTTEESNAPADTSNAEGEPKEKELKPLTISIAQRGLEAFDKENDVSYKEFKEKFNVEFEIYPVPNSNWMDTIRQYAAANDLPDVFVGEGWDRTTEIVKYITEGLVREIPEDMIAKYPVIANNFKMIDTGGERWTDGKWYFVPRFDAFNALSAYFVSYYYRKDYVNNLRDKGKLPIEPDKVETYDDLTNLMRAMAKEDPDNNGQPDTFGLTLHRAFEFNVIYPNFGVRDWNYNDGKWVYGYKSEEARQATKWMWEIMKEGILDPEYVANTQEQRLEKFCTGKAGLMLNNGNTTDATNFRRNTWEKINPDLPVEDYVSAVPCPSVNGQRAMRPKPYWMCTYFNADCSDEKLDRMLYIMDWLQTDEGAMWSRYGVEGRDYTLSPDGEITSLLEPNAEGLAFYGEQNYFINRLRSLPNWGYNATPRVKPLYQIPWDEEMGKIMETYTRHTYERQWTFFLATPKKLESSLDDYAQNSIIEIITSAADFDAAWQKYIDTLYNEYDLQAIEDEVNAEAAKLGDKAKFIPAPNN